MKEITYNAAIQLLSEIGHQSNVETFIHDQYGDEQRRTVLNDGFCYNPFFKKSLGGSSNEENAKVAVDLIMKTPDKRFKVYSSYYNWANNTYQIQ